jgi:ornithine decarboxylase
VDHFKTSLCAVRALDPDIPVAVNRPWLVTAAAERFTAGFSATILYAVKANPSPWVLDALWAGGVRAFDVASDVECALVRGRFPDATLAFMHPVKSRNAIRKAYFDHGVRIFALDSADELAKIVDETGGARDLTLVIRMAVENTAADLPLAAKFGVSGDEAVALLRAARAATREDLGISFHVGSQCMDPNAWLKALGDVSEIIRKAAVVIDIIDVGGGFPSRYPGREPPDLSLFFNAIETAFEDMPVTMNCELWAEPGRALVAEATSIVARVELRKGGALYINDGSYGTLFDATHVAWRYPVRVLRANGDSISTATAPFQLYGPTCDSIDAVDGLIDLPADIREGDFIEFGMLGAYGVSMATRFNGFGDVIDITSAEMPWASQFASELSQAAQTGRVLAFKG